MAVDEQRVDDLLEMAVQGVLDDDDAGYSDGNRPSIHVEQDSAQEYRWHLKGANGEIEAQGEGHGREDDAWDAVETARRNMLMATLER